MGITYQIDENLTEVVSNKVWIVDGALIYPFIGRFPARMAVLRLRDDVDNTLVVWSPLPGISKEIVEQIEALGSISYVVAPNSMHWLGVTPFLNLCSVNKDTIKVCAALGLTTKKEVLDSGFKGDYKRPEHIPEEWNGNIQVKHIPGIPSQEEVVLYHVQTKTLLTADLAFNLQQHNINPKLNVSGIIPYYLKACDGYRPCCLTRTFWMIMQDVKACHQAMEEILEEFDFETLILAHGEIIETHAKEKLRVGTIALLDEWRRKQLESSKNGTSPVVNTYVVVAGIALMIGFAISYSNVRNR